MNGTLVAWAAEIVLLGWRDWKKSKRFPYPSEVLVTFLFFGLISMLPDSSDPLGPLLGWGVVVATLLNVVNPAAIGTGTSVTANTVAAPAVNAPTAPLTVLPGGTP